MSLLIRISILGTDKQTDKLSREKRAKEQKGSIIFHVMGSIRVSGIFLAHWCEFCSKSRQRSSIVTLTQSKRRDKWLEQVGEKSAEKVQVS